MLWLEDWSVGIYILSISHCSFSKASFFIIQNLSNVFHAVIYLFFNKNIMCVWSACPERLSAAVKDLTTVWTKSTPPSWPTPLLTWSVWSVSSWPLTFCSLKGNRTEKNSDPMQATLICRSINKLMAEVCASPMLLAIRSVLHLPPRLFQTIYSNHNLSGASANVAVLTPLVSSSLVETNGLNKYRRCIFFIVSILALLPFFLDAFLCECRCFVFL